MQNFQRFGIYGLVRMVFKITYHVLHERKPHIPGGRQSHRFNKTGCREFVQEGGIFFRKHVAGIISGSKTEHSAQSYDKIQVEVGKIPVQLFQSAGHLLHPFEQPFFPAPVREYPVKDFAYENGYAVFQNVSPY